MEEHEVFRSDCAIYDALYCGTKAISPQGTRDLYVSNRFSNNDAGTTEDARQVVNIIFQLIESQIDVNLPMPAVESKEELDSEGRKRMIEGQLTYMAADANLRRINTENERIVKKNGLGYFKVGYNPNFKAHTYVGKIETTNPHPGNVVLQPGVYKIKDMDYMFHIENRTIPYICRTYGEEFREELETENLEYGQLDYFVAESEYYHDEKSKKLSVVEAWYKDNDGDVGLFTWVGDTVLRDKPKFYYKRDDQGNIIEHDEVEVVMGQDEMGVPMRQTVKVKCHIPDYFPFIPWYNIPREKSPRGLSDPLIIFDQQEGIKKLLSMEEKKQIMGTTKIFVRKGSSAATRITNATMQIIETEDPVSDVVTKDLKTPDGSLVNLYQIYRQAAKEALGITEASQGRAENANLSGRALEQLAAQTQGRLGVKSEEKDIAYTELYRTWYDFLLAFADMRMPFRSETKDANQDTKAVFGYWDKGLLVKQDDSGEWYYPEFDIFVQAETALPKDKRFILDIAQQAGGRIDNVQYWMLMESIGVPQASAILEMERAKMEEAKAMEAAQMQQPPQPQADMGGQMPQQPMPQQPMAPPPAPMGGVMGQMAGQGGIPPELQPIFDALPPEIQQQLQAMPPEQQVAFLSQPPEQIAAMVQQIQQQMQMVQQIPPEQQQAFMQLLQTNPEQAMALLQQMGGA
jgi:hypothetical protein